MEVFNITFKGKFQRTSLKVKCRISGSLKFRLKLCRLMNRAHDESKLTALVI